MSKKSLIEFAEWLRGKKLNEHFDLPTQLDRTEHWVTRVLEIRNGKVDWQSLREKKNPKSFERRALQIHWQIMAIRDNYTKGSISALGVNCIVLGTMSKDFSESLKRSSGQRKRQSDLWSQAEEIWLELRAKGEPHDYLAVSEAMPNEMVGDSYLCADERAERITKECHMTLESFRTGFARKEKQWLESCIITS